MEECNTKIEINQSGESAQTCKSCFCVVLLGRLFLSQEDIHPYLLVINLLKFLAQMSVHA